MASELSLPNIDHRVASRRLNSLKRTLESVLTDVRSTAVGAGDEALSQVQNAITGTLDTVSDFSRWVEDNAAQAPAALKRTMHENPIPACAVAVGAGALLALFLLKHR